MDRKLLFIPIISLVISLCVSSFAFAETTTDTSRSTARSTLKTENQTNLITNLKNRADQEIERRITSLNGLSVKIDTLKKLSDTDKSKYKSEIQTEVDSLNTLRAKIDADTDLIALKTDVQSIVKSYRIYLLYMPQMRILIAADRMDLTADLLSSQAAQLETRINLAQGAGHDVSSLSASLTDMKAKITDAKTQYQNAVTAVSSLTPEGYPGNKGNLDQAKADIKAGAADLLAAHKDAMQIKKGLKSFEGK